MLAEKILQKINEETFDFQGERQRSNGLRGSSSGKCARAIAYQYHGAKSDPLNARAKLVFQLGHHCEEDLAVVAESLGVLKDRQREVTIEIAGQFISGHIDGITTDEDGNGVVVDFKSINTLGFKRAEKTADVGDYIYQLHFYMHGLGLKKALILYYNKDTSHLCEVPISYDTAVWERVKARFTKVIQSTPSSLPDREYAPNDKGRLPWQCSYCNFCKACWPEANLAFDNAGKPQLTV